MPQFNPEEMVPTQPPEPSEPPPPAEGMATCSKCGISNPKDFVFCGNCGNRLRQVIVETLDRTQKQPEEPAPAPTAAAKKPKGKLSLIKPDGSEGGTHFLEEQENIIGRGLGRLFDNDSYLSPTHARITFTEGLATLEDLGSFNGVFMKITNPISLKSGDIFRVGQELLRFDVLLDPQALEDGTEIMGSPNPGYWGRISVVMAPGEDGSAFPLLGDEMVLGRERGDILFSDDGYVSGAHAKVSFQEDGYYLTDLGSSNGTFIRISQSHAVPSGTFILVGQQLFRFDY